MTGPPREVAAVRVAVRADLRALGAAPGALVLVACSGGADSLALAAAVAFEAPRAGLRAGAVTVDHGLHPASASVAQRVRETCAGELGLDPVLLTRVAVGRSGGPEAAARTARYAALERLAADAGAVAVLLGHTLDDQAETVLLGLARGSGARSLAGMPAVRGVLRRPLLGVGRAVVRAACAAHGLAPWEDPSNADRRLARARARHDALPALEAALGPGVAAALARSAAALREDADALDELAAQGDPFRADAAGSSAAVAELLAAPAALRRRWLRSGALAAGCPAGALAVRHVDAVDALLLRWRGQGPVHLPGGARAHRACGRLVLTPAGGDPTG
ncbi:tRNA lysidine(34) synthetase TilS [Paenibacillus sp. TRM 82003]|uniref:tRNA lysidine(34) synthetase TilS n=1 Tax=Kineococcus sp. TRM81007 TaxID=2925831 RepID=UPI001F5755E5|nr:tRNA lysidine(34) synthetase TilS [Kineococcus sp. TRM81007]MCI2239459.1 tRNA lysidine(34) synthetase TilS [Kineococcus sp. TRM81007]MCI3919259.1 tRNA lysidine(34) synthetase TilS [Paenibacillus sp. TRM 82003]